MDQSKNLLTVGSVPKKMLLFAVPVFFSNLFQQLYNAADSLIVGNFIGEEALAAVSSSGSLIMLLTGFINGVSMGAGVLIARFYGAQDKKSMERTVHTTVALGVAAGLLLTVVGVLFTPQILRWMGTPETVLPSSIAYFRTYFLGSVAVILYNVGASMRQPQPDEVLDHRLADQHRAGPAVCRGVPLGRRERSAGDHHQPDSQRGTCLPQADECGHDVQGYPAQGSLRPADAQADRHPGHPNINAFGADAMAGCGTYYKLEGFAFLPVTCFALALSTFISQNIGAEKYDRVKAGMKFGLICSPVLAECIGILFYIFAPYLIGAFNSNPDVISFGVQQARTLSLFYCLLSYSHCCAGILRGFGRPIIPMIIMLADWCLFRITYITIAVRIIPNIQVVFWAYPITWTISTILFTLYLRKIRFPVTSEKERNFAN